MENMSAMQRKLVLAFFTMCVGLLAGVTTAYACVPLRGDGTVAVVGDPTDGTVPQNSGTFTGYDPATGTPASDNLRYCESGNVFPGWDSSAEAQADGGDTIVVVVNPSTTTSPPECNKKLTAGNYSVIVNNATTASASPFTLVSNGTVNVWSIVRTTGCFTSATPNGNITLSTAFSVNTLGVGAGIYTLPSMNRVDGTNAASSVCVGRSGTGAQGIFVPLKVEAVI